jgi:hypothetical protein
MVPTNVSEDLHYAEAAPDPAPGRNKLCVSGSDPLSNGNGNGNLGKIFKNV